MARQKGHIKYVGTLGEVRHFKIKGNDGYFAGLKGGPSSEQIASDPAFVRTRENMNEFGGSAITGKSLRTSIAGLIRNNGDSQVTGRITAIMKKINLEDGSEARGQRAILVVLSLTSTLPLTVLSMLLILSLLLLQGIVQLWIFLRLILWIECIFLLELLILKSSMLFLFCLTLNITVLLEFMSQKTELQTV